jgi:hypothetical protein
VEVPLRTIPVMLGSYALLLSSSGIVVEWALDAADIDAGDQQRDTGTVIGKAENVLVLTLMLVEAYTALGVIFAAKSIVRKSDMDTGDTSYYLTGTIVNFTYSVLVGVVAESVIVPTA